MEFDRPEYGTRTNPAQLVRDSLSRYFSYESNGEEVHTTWSNEQSALDCYLSYEQLIPDLARSSVPSVVGMGANDAIKYVEGATSGVHKHLRNTESVAFFALGVQYDGIASLGWRRPFKRFDDRNEVSSQAVANLRKVFDEALFRRIIRATGSSEFFASADCEVQVWRRGALKRIEL